jgi:predicted Zn-dependent protease
VRARLNAMGVNVDNLERLLARGVDTAVLRVSLGNAYLDDNPALAETHLERALALDDTYSAAWKLLGKARAALGNVSGAAAAWQRGIAVAEKRGDMQAVREMQVFLRRLTR